jgi:hypothetical protein
MVSKTVKVVVIDGKKIEKTIELQPTAGAKPVTLEAVDQGKYLLAEEDTGFAPENITVKRVGDDLCISLEGEGTDTPQLVIHDYYLNESQLVGKSEDGAYYNYVTAYGQGSEAIAADTSAPLTLGNESIPDLAESLITDDSNPDLLWVLAGLGLLGLVGGAIAIAHHNKSDDHHSVTESGNADDGGNTPVVPSVISGTLDNAIDDVGSKQGIIESGKPTDDNQPTFNGSGVEPGNTVVIIDTDGSPIGSTTADENGNWSFTPDVPLADGSHDISAIVVDGEGNQSEPTNDIVVVVDTVAPAASDNNLVQDSDGETVNDGVTNDNTPAISGDAEPGGVVIISDNGEVIGSVQVDDKGEWSFTPDEPLDDGDHVITVVVDDEAGNVSPPSEDINFTVDTVAPDAATNLVLTDDVAPDIGPINSGDTTDDNTPTFSGDAEADSTVIITDNGEVIGSVIADQDGNWSFTPETPMTEGDHSLSVVVEDDAGNKSSASDPIDFTVDTSTIPSSSGSEDFESASKHVFDTAGDSVVLDSGLTITFVDGPVDGSDMNAFTEISDKGMFYFAPEELGTQALILVENSETKFEFDGGTESVSFDVNASSFAGSTVNYYDQSGNLLHSEGLPVQADGEVQTLSWTAPEGERISSMTIDTGNGVGNNVITRVDNFNWGPAAEDASQPVLLSENQHQSGTISIDGHETLNLTDLLAHATQDLLIADGKDQVAITGEQGSSVEIDFSSHASDWHEDGQVTAGGVVYDVYQVQGGHSELLIEHDINAQQHA